VSGPSSDPHGVSRPGRQCHLLYSPYSMGCPSYAAGLSCNLHSAQHPGVSTHWVMRSINLCVTH